MKLTSLNKELEDAVDKYTINKAGVNKEIAASNLEKNNMPERSGNSTPVPNPGKTELLGGNPVNGTNKNEPPKSKA